ncbi:MAG: hypothetical protein ACYDAQ_06010 [Mycobacteriales bacterium]
MVAGLALGPAVVARAGAAPPPATLTATTVVTATGNAATSVVHLTGPLAVPATSVPDLTVSDPAHLVAIALVGQQGLPREPALMVAALPSGAGTRYVYLRLGYVGPGYAASSYFYFNPVLPAGLYRIYVIATGPEQVTWHLPAPVGTRRLSATIPVIAHSLLAVAPGVGNTLVSSYVTAAGQFLMPHPAGFMVDVEWMQGVDPAPVFDEEDAACWAYDPSSLATAVQAAPAELCPGGAGGEGGPIVINRPPIRYGGVGTGWYATYVGGTWQQKVALAVTGVTSSASIRLIWLDVG